MNVVVRHQLMTIENFLAWEARQEEKYEFNGYEPVAMTGGSFAHSQLQANLAFALVGRLRHGACRFAGSDFKVLTPTRVRYPDGQVTCTTPDPGATFSTAPVVLFEITSPSTESVDVQDKVGEYTNIDSVQRYVILRQDRVEAIVHARVGAAWTVQTLAGGDTLHMPEIGIELPMAELFEGIFQA